MIHYLKHVKNFWATLVNHDRAQMARIDLHTVDTLQLYAPRASTVDRKIVKGKILTGEVFCNFSRSERAAIWGRLRSHETCDGIIPSLHTFFRDVLYLEVCANAVKRLVALNKQHPTIRRALVHSFRPGPSDTDCLIQTSETKFRRQPGSNDERLSLGYRQIWLYAMRHYPDMAKNIRGGQAANPARAKARAKADESVIHDMATLARKLGFGTTQINAILQQSPDRQIARAALLKARKPDHFHYDRETFESLIEQIASCFARAIPNEGPPMTLTAGRAIKLKDRYGIPPEHAQPLDRPHLFLDQLHSATSRQRNLSSLEVRRSVYYAFFGKPSSQTYMPRTPPAWSSASEPSSPLFVPRDNTPANEPYAEDMSISGLSEGPSSSRQRLSETREHQPEGRRQGQQPSRPPTAMHSPSPARELSPDGSAGRGSPPAAGGTTDHWDSSDAEDQPATNERREGGAGEDDCTEIDENEFLHRAEGEDSTARDLSAVETSIPGTPTEREMPEGLDESDVGGDDTRPSGPIRRNRNRDGIWRPYDTARRGNRRAARTVSPGGERVTDATDRDPIAEYRPGPEPLRTIGEHTEVEQPAEEPHPLNDASQRASSVAESPAMVTQVGPHPVAEQPGTSPGTSRDAPQREAAGNDDEYLAQAEQSEHRNRKGEEHISPIPSTDPGEGITGEVAHDREAIADQVEELLQEERHSLERADPPSQVEVSRVARRVTEIPADLPSLISRLREGVQRDEPVPTVDDPPAAHPEDGAAVRPLRTEPIVQDTEGRWYGDHSGDVNPPRSPGRRTGTDPRPHGSERAEGEDFTAVNLSTIETSTLIPGEPVGGSVWEGLEERTVGDDTGSSGPVQVSSPLRSSRTSRTQPRIRRNRNRDAIWQPYNPAQRGNRGAARTVAPEEERVTIGNSTEPGPSAEHWPSPEPLQPIGEHAGVEQPAEEPQAADQDGTLTGGGDEPASRIPPSDGAEGISGEQLTQGRESIADQVGNLVQEERHSQEQADAPARLEASRAHAVARRVTEIPADLPSLIAQLRQGSQRDTGVSPADATSVARPEDEASLRPLPLEPIAQSTEEGWPGSNLDGANLPRSPQRPPKIGPQAHQPEGAARKLRKNQTTRREVNRAGARDAAIADELWASDGGGDEVGGIMAETTAVSPQDAERYPAVLADPEQAQREAIARQEGEDLLFDTPHMMPEAEDTEMADFEGNRPPAVAARPNQKVTKPSKVAKPKQAQPGRSSKTSRAGLSSRRRAVDVEARVQGEVTQLDATQRDITNPISTGVSGSNNQGPASGSSPGRRATITFRAYQRGEWTTRDMVSVDSDHPVEAQAIAERYARDPEQEVHFYDRSLRKVAVDQCVRAAIDDGSFTILMSLGRGLAVTRNLVASVTELFENVGTAGPVIEEEEEEL